MDAVEYGAEFVLALKVRNRSLQEDALKALEVLNQQLELTSGCSSQCKVHE